MTLEKDEKFEEELTCRFKIDIRNLKNLDSSNQKSKVLHFNGLLLTKVWVKKYREVIFHDTGDWCKIWRKIDFWFRK